MNKIAEKINNLIDSIKDLFGAIKDGFKKFLNIFKQIQWLDVPAATYVRWILAVVVCANTVITHLGLNPIAISENNVYQIVSAILSGAVLFVNTYKNNSTSKEALLSDKIMHSLKDAEINDEEEMITRLEGIIVELRQEDKIVRDHSNKIEDTLEPIPEVDETVTEEPVEKEPVPKDAVIIPPETDVEETNDESAEENIVTESESEVEEIETSTEEINPEEETVVESESEVEEITPIEESDFIPTNSDNAE